MNKPKFNKHNQTDPNETPNSAKDTNYQILCHNLDILCRNYDLLSHNFYIISCNYDILSPYYDLAML